MVEDRKEYGLPAIFNPLSSVFDYLRVAS